MADEEQVGPDEIDLAIARASERSPKLQRARQKIDQMIGSGDDEGFRILANAIRRMMHQE